MSVQVNLVVAKHSNSQRQQLDLKRERVTNKSVTSQLCTSVSRSLLADSKADPGKLGYIRVATFNKQTAENVQAAIQHLHADGANRCAHVCLEIYHVKPFMQSTQLFYGSDSALAVACITHAVQSSRRIAVHCPEWDVQGFRGACAVELVQGRSQSAELGGSR